MIFGDLLNAQLERKKSKGTPRTPCKKAAARWVLPPAMLEEERRGGGGHTVNASRSTNDWVQGMLQDSAFLAGTCKALTQSGGRFM